MNYVVDLTNPKIKWAMEHIGVTVEDLEKKTIEDFEDDSVAIELQEIRYDFYKRKQAKTVDLINHVIKTQYQNTSKAFSSIKESTLVHEKSFRKRPLLNYKDRKVIMHAIEASKFTPKALTPMVRRRKCKTVDKFRVFQEKQKENLKKIQMDTEKSWMKTQVPEENMRTHESHQKTHNLFRSKSDNSDNEKGYYSDIDEKLQLFEEKLQKSANLHNSFIEKRKKLVKTPEAPKPRPKDNLSERHLHRIIQKGAIIKRRKLKQLREFQEKLDNLKNIKDSKINKMMQANKDKAKEISALDEALRLKTLHSESFIASQRQNMIKGIEIKAEITKLRDEQALLNSKRLQQLSFYKKKVIIEKQICERDKFEEMKKAKERVNNRSRDESMKETIEREKLRDSVYQIQKSPNSKKSQKLIKDMEIDLSQCQSKFNRISNRGKGKIESKLIQISN